MKGKTNDYIFNFRYGTVWKGIVNEQHVAVKIFTAQHRQYFLNEKDIYDVPLLESPALLSYFGKLNILDSMIMSIMFCLSIRL